MKLIDGQSFFNKSFEKYLSSPTWIKVARQQGIRAPSEIANIEDNPTYAHISHSRIVADCPNCNNAEFVWRDGPHVMACANCGNADIQNKLRQVIIPDILNMIEGALLRRPNPATRNWFPGETLEQLETENEEQLA